jgi:hypothetical protein
VITWAFAREGQETEALSALVADRIWPTKGRNFGECKAIAVLNGNSAYGAERYRIPRLRGDNAAENIFITTRETWAANKFAR